MNRVALRDTVLPTGGGPDGRSPVFVPEGTGFDTSFYVLHRLPSIWGDDSNEFRPERWDEFKPASCEFVPFGLGPRMCAGQQKALMETSYVISRLLQEFQDIEARDEREWQGRVQLTAKNAHGCLVTMTPKEP
jgi:cytochrome P450